MNAGTIFILVLLIAMVSLAIRYIVKQKKKGNKCIGCSGSCSSCGGRCPSEKIVEDISKKAKG